MRWPLQPLQPFQQTQLQPPFGQSVDSLCHPWFTTTNVSYRFPILKLPPPPCAVLLVIVYTHNKSKTKTSWNHSEVTPRDVLRWQVVPKVATMIPHCLHIDGKTGKKHQALNHDDFLSCVCLTNDKTNNWASRFFSTLCVPIELLNITQCFSCGVPLLDTPVVGRWCG